MAIPVNIDELLNRTIIESNRVEFKEGFNPDPIIRSICAFANDIDNIGGGYIIIGVEEDNGAPKFPLKGISKDQVDYTLKKLREYCHYIEPLYEPVVEPIYYQDVYLIVIWANGGFGRPYKAPQAATSKQSHKYYYIRKFANSVIASPDEERELFYISSNIPFDDRPCLPADINDLDINLIHQHLTRIHSTLLEQDRSATLLSLAQDLQIVDGPVERIKPRNVGILMFCSNPQKYFKNAKIEVVSLPTETGENMTESIFDGPIQVQLEQALGYIKNSVIKEAIIKVPDQAQSIRFYNYPFRAVEEILSNAVYHRSYQINEPISVRITPAEIEITSFPGFDRSITDEQIARGDYRARIYRNRRIGDFLKELKLIEGRNTGFPNARKALEQNGSEPLQIKMNPERDYLSVIIPVHSYFKPKVFEDDEYVQRIMDELKGQALTLTQLAHAMGYKGITAKLRRTIKQLLNVNRLIYVYEDGNVKLKENA